MLIDPFTAGWIGGTIFAALGAYIMVLLSDNWDSERFWQAYNYAKSRPSYAPTRGAVLTSRMDIAEVRWMYNRAQERGLKKYALSEFEIVRDEIGNWYHMYMSDNWKNISIFNKLNWSSADIAQEYEHLRSQITDKKQGVIIGHHLVIQDCLPHSHTISYSLRSSTKTLGCPLTDAERMAVESLYLEALENNEISTENDDFVVYLEDVDQKWYHKRKNIPEVVPVVKSTGVNLTDTEAKQVNSLYFTAIANGQNFIQNSQFIMFKNSAGFWEHRRKT